MPQISVNASTIVARAISLADLVNTQFISYDDKLNSLNESWKDVYNFLTERNDDYFMTLTTLSMTQAIASAPLNTNEWLIAPPSDLYKLRILDYNYSGTWQPMQKFALDRRNNYNTIMQYRFQGQNLWIIGGPFNGGPPQLRIGYYPPPVSLYFPNSTQFFTTSSGQSDAVLATAVDPFYLPGNFQSSLPVTTSQQIPGANGMLYSVPGVGVYYASNNTNTNTLVVSSATNITLPKYYKGYLYYLQSGDVFGAAFDPKNPALLSPTSVTAAIGPISWYDIVASNTAYMIDATNVRSATVNGTTDWGAGSVITTPLAPPSGILSYGLVQGIQFWVTAAGALTVNGVSLATSVTRAISDGTYIYYLTGLNLYRGTIGTPSGTPTLTAELLSSDIRSINNFSTDYIGAIQSEGLNLIAISDTPDYTITYPNNLATEILAYQMAMDFARKQDNQKHMADLKERHQAVVNRYLNDQVMRDDYKPERINPVGSGKANLPGLPGGYA